MSDVDIVREALGKPGRLAFMRMEALAALDRMEMDFAWYKFHLDDRDAHVEELADERDRLRAALEPLYWFFRMIDSGGPDMSDLDATVYAEAAAAAEQVGTSIRP